jgi:hypothetical protein
VTDLPREAATSAAFVGWQHRASSHRHGDGRDVRSPTVRDGSDPRRVRSYWTGRSLRLGANGGRAGGCATLGFSPPGKVRGGGAPHLAAMGRLPLAARTRPRRSGHHAPVRRSRRRPRDSLAHAACSSTPSWPPSPPCRARGISDARSSTRMDVLASRILLHPADLERSLRFYGETLALAVFREWGTGAHRGVGRCLLRVAVPSFRRG